MAKGKSQSKRPAKKLIHKYILEIRDEDTFEKKLDLRLSRLNVLTLLGTATIAIVSIMLLLIVYTPLREKLLGYRYVSLSRQAVEANFVSDSLARELKLKSEYLANIKRILKGTVGNEDEIGAGKDHLSTTQVSMEQAASERYQNIQISRSKEDSLLRTEIESEEKFNLNFSKGETSSGVLVNVSSTLFFIPLKGLVTDTFNFRTKHYGIDIAAPENEAIKATLDGTVIFANWTSETGFIIGIQHNNNLMSIYKHNSILLKEVGNKVKAGEVVAVVGSSGDLSTGPHLHFELWSNGNPLNPANYMVF